MSKQVLKEECMEMEGGKRPPTVHTGILLHPWRGLLIKTVDPSELHRYLMQEGFFENSIEADELQDHLRESDLPRRELWEKLLHYLSLKEGKEPMSSFLYALKSSGYEFQEDWIRERSQHNLYAENHTKNYTDIHGPFRKLLELFAGPICREFVPQDIMPYFYEKKLLRSDHIEIINTHKTHNQRVLGILHYITLSGTNDWPHRFCEALLKAGESHPPYKELAKLITPKIDEFTASVVLDDFAEANSAHAAAASYSTCSMETDEVLTSCNPEVMNQAISFTGQTPLKLEQQFRTSPKRLNVNQAKDFEMRVTLYYYGNVISELDLFQSQVYCFHSGHHSTTRLNIPGIENMHQCPLPPVPQSFDQVQHQNIQTVLNGLDGGFVVYCDNGDIFVTRYCRTRLFVSNTDENLCGESLMRHMTYKAFDHEQYKLNMESVFIGLAQKWNFDRANDDLAVTMKIVCCEARQMFDMTYGFDQ